MCNSIGIPNKTSLKTWDSDISIHYLTYNFINEKRFCHVHFLNL